MDPSKELAKKRYDWLAKHYPDGSAAIKGMKAIINVAAAHANLVSADNNFRFNEQSGSFDAPFFDIEDEYLVKTDLWMIGNIAYGLMDLFYGVNRDRNVVTFVDDFASRLGKLVSDNKALRAEVTASERYKRTQERLAGVASSNVNPSSNLSP